MSDDAQTELDDESRPSVGRALSILDLFTVEAASLTTEQICERRRLSVPTGYRYIRELVAAGLLVRHSRGRYSLGAKIIALDYTIRQSDPLLRVATPIMQELARRTGCSCVVSSLLGDRILDTHREGDTEGVALAYGRGRPRPMFYGGAPKVILAEQPTPWLRKLYESKAAEIAAADMGRDWTEFRKSLAHIRKEGFYVSHGELEAGISAVAVPIRVGVNETHSALALVTSSVRFDLLNIGLLADMLINSAASIAEDLTRG